MNRKKILVAVTSFEKYPTLPRATGLWLGEAVHFVKKMEEAGYQVDYVSPKGGYTPIDPHSLAMAEPVDWEWYQDKAFMNRLGATLSPAEVNPDGVIRLCSRLTQVQDDDLARFVHLTSTLAHRAAEGSAPPAENATRGDLPAGKRQTASSPFVSRQ